MIFIIFSLSAQLGEEAGLALLPLPYLLLLLPPSHLHHHHLHVAEGARRARRSQPVHLPPAARVLRCRPAADLPPLRLRRLRQGLCGQADQPLQVLR